MKPLRPGLLLLLLICATAPLAAAPEDREAAVHAFVEQMVDKHGFEREQLLQLMAGARYRGDIIRAMQRPAEKVKPWHQYRKHFVTRARIQAGARFWKANADTLARAELEYGVPPQIIVAIIGAETNYGGYIGKHRVLDALTTLAFGYPRRAEEFQRYLEAFLLLSREEDIDVSKVIGSYAGAMGLPQFMPTNYRTLAVDYDQDGKRDLWESKPDIIGSVANYFKHHRWRSGEQVIERARTGATLPAEKDIAGKRPKKPTTPVSDWKEKGVQPENALPADTPATLMRLQARNGDEFWLTLHNFYVITRYNHSNMYAMAVYQLSQEILAEREATKDELVRR